jgi:hypothetical protein
VRYADAVALTVALSPLTSMRSPSKSLHRARCGCIRI